MSLAQQLLLRALIARFWDEPYRRALVRWGTELHDRFMLPHFVEQDFDDVHRRSCTRPAIPFEAELVRAAFRVPLPAHRRRRLARRPARAAPGARAVARARRGSRRRRHGALRRFVARAAAGQGRRPRSTRATSSPATAARCRCTRPARDGEYVAGVRYRAWQPPHCLHPTIPVHAPLVFDLVDTWTGRSLGGCTYHVAHPGGRSYDTLPGQRLRSGEPPAGPLLRDRPHAGPDRAGAARRVSPSSRSRWTCAGSLMTRSTSVTRPPSGLMPETTASWQRLCRLRARGPRLRRDGVGARRRAPALAPAWSARSRRSGPPRCRRALRSGAADHPRERRHLQRLRRPARHGPAVAAGPRAAADGAGCSGLAFEAGLVQRARLLNLILADLYGPQRLLRDGCSRRPSSSPTRASCGRVTACP